MLLTFANLRKASFWTPPAFVLLYEFQPRDVTRGLSQPLITYLTTTHHCLFYKYFSASLAQKGGWFPSATIQFRMQSRSFTLTFEHTVNFIFVEPWLAFRPVPRLKGQSPFNGHNLAFGHQLGLRHHFRGSPALFFFKLLFVHRLNVFRVSRRKLSFDVFFFAACFRCSLQENVLLAHHITSKHGFSRFLAMLFLTLCEFRFCVSLISRKSQ